MPSTSHITVDKKALENNVGFIRALVGSETQVSAVIKGNAYGHGYDVIIPALEELGIRHFSVYSSPEAREAFRHIRHGSTIMIMGFIHPPDLNWILQNRIEFFVPDLSVLKAAIRESRSTQKKAILHLEVETGMYRTGLTLPQLKDAIGIIHANEDRITVRGLSSHLAGAESIANHQRVKKQLTVFNKRTRFLHEQGIYPAIRHIASSAATIAYPESRMDLVRTGILIYGYWPTRETFINYVQRRKDRTDPLKRALSWYSQVMLTKEVPEGEFIGYGLNFQASHKMKIMVVPVGYCNGYSRSLSNNGHVIVHGQRSAVIGIVNMNMIICDITDIPNVQAGDPIILIGEQAEARISFSSFAEMNNSLNYEILARLPENIERFLINH
jgi:alanine racemase